VKANSVKQEYEKQEELKRSALRAVSALSCIPDSGVCYMCNIYCTRTVLNAVIVYLVILQCYLFCCVLYAADKSPQLLEFVNLIRSSSETAELFESIQQDTSSVNVGSSAVDSMDLS